MKTSTIVILSLIGALILGIIIYKLVTAKKKRRQRLMIKVMTAYGAVPKREYTDTELEKIKTYFRKTLKEGEYYVDDITWNDLDMDSIFALMNHTFSSAGEEVLYNILRKPVFDIEELTERERLIIFFMENEQIRNEFMADFATIGRTKKYSMVEFIDQFRDFRTEPDAVYYSAIISLVIAVVVLCFKPLFGVILLIASIISNMLSYFKKKGTIEPYYVSLSAMAYLVAASEQLAEHDVPELKKYLDELKQEASYVKSLTKDMAWLGQPGAIGSSSDLLQVFVDYFRLMTHLDFIKFNKMVKSVRRNEEHLKKLFAVMGYLESMIAIGSYRRIIPFYCNGQLKSGKDISIHIKDGYHPLLKDPVANSITEERPVLLTGSNASGKSTFLRMTALSALMAQTTNTVHAHEYSASFYRLYTSMALRDDIQSNDSYYIVEIKAIKRIMDVAEHEVPVLCFVDEVLRGTNTVERISASSQILKVFAEKGAMVFAATHDIELTSILENIYSNYHFTEEVDEDSIAFTYKLLNGKATSRNAIKLLQIMGYEPEVVTEAESRAERFVESGVWDVINA